MTLSSSSDPVTALIDSTVPHLWLPRSVCDAFEQAFGLTYDPNTDLYIFNDSAKHSQLLQDKPSIVIALGNDNDPSGLVQITLPFAALDLEASYPIYANTTPYFPLRRATNDSQYTLGRAFLQEAYVVADYERSNFSVHQVSFSTQPQKIVAIYPPNSSLVEASGRDKQSLSTGAIAGISIGAVAAVVFIGTLTWFFCCGRKGRTYKNGPSEEQMMERPTEYYQKGTQEGTVHELNSHELQQRLDDSPTKPGSPHAELDSTRVYLISDDTQQHELPG
jgi:hypothetical protein